MKNIYTLTTRSLKNFDQLQNLLSLQTLKYTTQELKFSIKDFFSKCDQIHSFLRIWSHLLKKSLMENFIFCVVVSTSNEKIFWKFLNDFLVKV